MMRWMKMCIIAIGRRISLEGGKANTMNKWTMKINHSCKTKNECLKIKMIMMKTKRIKKISLEKLKKKANLQMMKRK